MPPKKRLAKAAGAKVAAKTRAVKATAANRKARATATAAAERSAKARAAAVKAGTGAKTRAPIPKRAAQGSTKTTTTAATTNARARGPPAKTPAPATRKRPRPPTPRTAPRTPAQPTTRASGRGRAPRGQARGRRSPTTDSTSTGSDSSRSSSPRSPSLLELAVGVGGPTHHLQTSNRAAHERERSPFLTLSGSGGKAPAVSAAQEARATSRGRSPADRTPSKPRGERSPEVLTAASDGGRRSGGRWPRGPHTEDRALISDHRGGHAVEEGLAPDRSPRSMGRPAGHEETVLFIAEGEDGTATPPVATSSLLLSIPDTCLTQHTLATPPPPPPREPQQQRLEAWPPTPARTAAAPTTSPATQTYLRMGALGRPRSPTTTPLPRTHNAASPLRLTPTNAAVGLGGFPAAPPSPSWLVSATSASHSHEPTPVVSAVPSTSTTQPLSGVVAPTHGAVRFAAGPRDGPLQPSSSTPQQPQRQPQQQQQQEVVAVGSTDLTGGEDPDRLRRERRSTQLITRAAVTRPLASPGTLWICLDDDDDADVTEPTCLTSPTLRNVRIAAAAAAVGEGEGRGGSVPHGTTEDGGATQPLFDEVVDHASRSRHIFALGTREGGEGERKGCQGPANDPHSTRVSGGYPSTVPPASGGDRPQPTTAAATLARERSTIRQILSPTFRPRRGTVPVPAASPPADVDNSASRLGEVDEVDDAEEEEEEEEKSGRSPRTTDSSQFPETPVTTWPLSMANYTAWASPANRSFMSTTTAPYVEHDDDSSSSSSDSSAKSSTDTPLACLAGLVGVRGGGGAVTATPTASQSFIRDDDSGCWLEAVSEGSSEAPRVTPATVPPTTTTTTTTRATAAPPAQDATHTKAGPGSDPTPTGGRASPVRSVKDFIFPDRNGPRSPLFPFHNEDTLTGLFPGSKGGAGGAQAAGGRGGGGRGDLQKDRTSDEPAKAGGRPVDQLWQFFPSRFTKKSFHDAARRIIPADHFLEKGQFWDAFTRVDFVGEGSFGLVWRCTTLDGDLVAVKSCPVRLSTRACIEDAFSSLREVAVMRFLNEMQVPYILPLHSAFTVSEPEALPPLAVEALQWQRELRQRAEAAVLERQVQLLSTGGAGARGNGPHSSRRGRHAGSLAAEIEEELERMAAAESSAERARRARLSSVSLPRFLSITEDEVLQSDGTVMLVFELCDGDLESIPRADGVVKGVAYCVSSALAAMHELGLLHLDLKPSNILFAYEHGPSQQSPRASAMLPALPSSTWEGTGTGSGGRASNASTSVGNSRAVKFYLTDFGNCRIVGPLPEDAVEDVYGTFEYMDLRALRDATCDRATDSFSLGCSLYELLFGQRVYPRCTNDKCLSDEDHTRECYVDAAARPIVLPLPAATLAAAEGWSRWLARGGTPADSTTRTIPLTALQRLVVALLRPDRAQRMTAAQCRDHLVRVYSITPTEGPTVSDPV